MECLNCGGAINSAIIGQVVRCNYCGSSVAWLPAVKQDPGEPEVQSSEVERLLRIAQLDIDSRRYESAAGNLERVLAIDPTHWRAQANRAIAEFWLGTDNFEHLPTVAEHLQKAAELATDNELIAAITRAIAYNIAQVVSIKNPAGVRLLNSLAALDLSKQLVPDFDARDRLIDDFAHRQAVAAVRRLSELLRRNKKQFDPPRSELEILGRVILLHTSPPGECLAWFVASVSYSPRLTGDRDLSALRDRVRDRYAEAGTSLSIPKFEFPFFGDAKLAF